MTTIPKNRKLSEDKAGKKRPGSNYCYQVMKTPQRIKMMKEWFLGIHKDILNRKYSLSGYQITHQLYNYAKRDLQPFFDEVLSILDHSGSKGVMGKYKINLDKANRLIKLIQKYNILPVKRVPYRW